MALPLLSDEEVGLAEPKGAGAVFGAPPKPRGPVLLSDEDVGFGPEPTTDIVEIPSRQAYAQPSLGARFKMNAAEGFEGSSTGAIYDRIVSGTVNQAQVDEIGREIGYREGALAPQGKAIARPYVNIPFADLMAMRDRHLATAEAAKPGFDQAVADAKINRDLMPAWSDAPGVFGKLAAGGTALAGQIAGGLPAVESLIGPAKFVAEPGELLMKQIARSAAREGGYNAVATGAANPLVQEVQKETGQRQEFDPTEFAGGVALGAGIGAGVGGGIRLTALGFRALQETLGRARNVDPKTIAPETVTAEDFKAAVASDPIFAAIAKDNGFELGVGDPREEILKERLARRKIEESFRFEPTAEPPSNAEWGRLISGEGKEAKYTPGSLQDELGTRRRYVEDVINGRAPMDESVGTVGADGAARAFTSRSTDEGTVNPAAQSIVPRAPDERPIAVTSAGEAFKVDPGAQFGRSASEILGPTKIPLLPAPEKMPTAPLTEEGVATARADIAPPQRPGPTPEPPPVLMGQEGRLPQTRDQTVEQRQADEAFRLAQRQKEKAAPDVRDTQVAGRQQGPDQRPVFLDDGFPVEILDRRMVPDDKGNMVETARVRRYDPRTGAPDPDGVEYEVPVRQLKSRGYAQDPRMAQDVVTRSEGPPSPELPRQPGPGRPEREPAQTYRTTQSDPTVPGAEGPATRTVPPRGPDAPVTRADRPEQTEAPYQGARWSRAEDAARDYQERQARGEAEPPPGAKQTYEGTKSNNSPKGQDRDGRWIVGDDGVVLSAAGGPIIFKDHVQAAKWILNKGQKLSPDQNFEIINHPTRPGLSVRETSRTPKDTPPPPGGKSGPGAEPRQEAPPRRDEAPPGEPRRLTGPPQDQPRPRPAEPPKEGVRGEVGPDPKAAAFEARLEIERARVEKEAKLAERGPPRDQRQTFLGFLRSIGGIAEDRGELKGMDLVRRFPGLVNNRRGGDGRLEGKSLDYAREAAAEQGYLRMDSTVADFLDLLDRASRGEKIYPFGESEGAFRQANPDTFLSENKNLVAVARAHAQTEGHGDLSPAEMMDIAERVGSIREGETVQAWRERVKAATDDAVMEGSLRDEAPTAPPMGKGEVDDAFDMARDPFEAPGAGRGDGEKSFPGDAGRRGGSGVGEDIPGFEAPTPRSREDAGPDGGRQTVIPGAERITDGELAQRRADAPLRGQNKPLDDGLFDTGARKQTDLLDAAKEAPAPEARTGVFEKNGKWTAEDNGTVFRGAGGKPFASRAEAETFLAKRRAGRDSAPSNSTFNANPFFDPGNWVQLAKDVGLVAKAGGRLAASGVKTIFDFTNMKALYKDFKEAFGDLGTGKKTPAWKHGGAIGDLLRWWNWSASGRLDSAAIHYDSPEIAKLSRQWHPHADAGRGEGYGDTFHEVIRRRFSGENMNKIGPLLERFAKDPERVDKMAQIVALVRNPGGIRSGTPIHDAARMIRDKLDAEVKWLKSLGVDVGDAIRGYFPRQWNTAQIMSNQAAFLRAATDQYLLDRIAPTREKARKMAEEWLASIVLGDIGVRRDGTDFVRLGGTPSSDFKKERVFGSSLERDPRNALAKFLHQDPVDVLTQHFQATARRGAWAQIMGDDMSKWKAIKQRILDEGNADALPEVTAMISSIAGVDRSIMSAAQSAAIGSLRTYGMMRTLPLAVMTAAVETAMPSLRAGMLHRVPGDVVRTIKAAVGKGGDNRALAEDLGLIHAMLGDSIVGQRFMANEPGSKFNQRLVNSYFRRTGLEGVTSAQKTVAVGTARVFLRRLSLDVSEGTSRAKSSMGFLKELGVEDPQAFAKWYASHEGGSPTLKDIQIAKGSQNPDTSKMHEQFARAVTRFVDQSVMAPTTATRPSWANTPTGSLAFMLQSYSYAFSKNVLKRAKDGAVRAATEKDLTMADRAALLAPGAMLPMLVAIQYGMGYVREAAFGSEKAQEKREKEKPAQIDLPLVPAFKLDQHDFKVMKAIDQAGFFGIFNPSINMVLSHRFERDAATALAGPAVGGVLSGADTMMKSWVKNSPNTNTAERNNAGAFYDLVIKPAVAGLGAALPPIPGALAIGASASGNVRDAYRDWAAGPEKKKGGLGPWMPQGPRMPSIGR